MTADDSGNVQQIVVQVNEPGAWVTTNHTVDTDGKTVVDMPSTELRDRWVPVDRRRTLEGMLRAAGRRRLSAGGGVPTRQPLLEAPVDPDRNPARGHRTADRVLLLAHPPRSDLRPPRSTLPLPVAVVAS